VSSLVTTKFKSKSETTILKCETETKSNCFSPSPIPARNRLESRLESKYELEYCKTAICIFGISALYYYTDNRSIKGTRTIRVLRCSRVSSLSLSLNFDCSATSFLGVCCLSSGTSGTSFTTASTCKNAQVHYH